MKKVFLFFILPILFVSCGVGNESRVDIRDDIIINSPQSDQIVSSPLFISGKAVGSWFFEASFPVQLVDLNGEIISSGIVQAKSDWMTSDFVDFEGTLDFYTDSETGELIFKNDNPSGLPEKEITYSVPVKFAVQDQEKLVENYIRENISELNPAAPVLGGSWYVLDMEFLSENTVKVKCEDGHIQNSFTANYSVKGDGSVGLSGIVENF